MNYEDVKDKLTNDYPSDGTAYLLFDGDPENPRFEVVLLNGIEDMYELIGCELVEYAPVRFGGEWLYAICDEEGTLHDPVPPWTIIGRSGDDLVGKVVGRVLLTMPPDDEGNDVSMTKEAALAVLECVVRSQEDGRYYLLEE